MELAHRFTVPVPVDQAWEHFNDIASVAECFPGATVSEADSDSFQGSVKVKLGPIALVYNGSGTFTEKDDTAHRMVVNAQGKDKRGNGTAGAVVTMSMTERVTDSGGSTDIEVLTDLAITGKPAQFGRGVMQDVSDKLLGQFVACLEQRFAASPAPAVAEPDVAPAPPTPPAAEPEPTLTDEAAPVAVEVPPVSPSPPAPPPAPAATPAAVPPRQDEALNLGATVLPVLVRSYWKHALAALVVVVLLIWLISAL